MLRPHITITNCERCKAPLHDVVRLDAELRDKGVVLCKMCLEKAKARAELRARQREFLRTKKLLGS